MIPFLTTAPLAAPDAASTTGQAGSSATGLGKRAAGDAAKAAPATGGLPGSTDPEPRPVFTLPGQAPGAVDAGQRSAVSAERLAQARPHEGAPAMPKTGNAKLPRHALADTALAVPTLQSGATAAVPGLATGQRVALPAGAVSQALGAGGPEVLTGLSGFVLTDQAAATLDLGAGVQKLSREELAGVLDEMGLPTDLAGQIQMVVVPRAGDSAGPVGLLMPRAGAAQTITATGAALTSPQADPNALPTAQETPPTELAGSVKPQARARATDRPTLDAPPPPRAEALATAGEKAVQRSDLPAQGAASLKGPAGGPGAGSVTSAVLPGPAGDGALSAVMSAAPSGRDAAAIRAGLEGLDAGSSDAGSLIKRLLTGQASAETATLKNSVGGGENGADILKRMVAEAMTAHHRPPPRAVTQNPADTPATSRSLTGAPAGGGEAGGSQSITGTANPQAQAAGTLNAAAARFAQAKPQRSAGRETAQQQVAVQVRRAAAEGQNRFTLQLHPAELGRVSVRLDFDGGRVRAQVTADRRDTLDMLQKDARSLQSALAATGLETDGGSLEFTLSDDSASAFDMAMARRDKASDAAAQRLWRGAAEAQADEAATLVLDAKEFIDPRVTNGVDIEV